MASFKDALQSTKVVKTAEKKTAVPVLQNLDDEIRIAAGDFLAKTRAKKALEAELAVLNADLAASIQAEQDKRAFRGEFNNSYKIPALVASDDKTEPAGELTITTKNVFKINPEDGDRIKKLFGKDYKTFFAEKFQVVLKDEVLSDTPEGVALQEELMAAIGDNFGKFFNTFTALKVKEDYDERIYGFAKTPEKLAEIRTIVEPSKSTLK